MKRRIISLLLAALLLLPASISMAASTPVTITSEDVRGNVGDTVSVAVSIAIEAPKLGQTMDSLQFLLVYDSAALEYVGIQEVSQDRISILGVQFYCNVTANAGKVAFSAASSGGATGSGVLMHVRFKILSPVSTMLVLKNVAYSFVTTSSGSQRAYTGGTINLGRVTGQSAPATIPPTATAPSNTQAPANASAAPTDEPRFPVTEVTSAPGTSPAPESANEDNDILAYIVFGLFIVVAILICVVLTLMIVRRGQNRAKMKFFEDDEEDVQETPEEPYDDSAYDEQPYNEEEAYEKAPQEEDAGHEEDEPPIRIVRRGKK